MSSLLLEGRTAVVTGASRGIGAAVARALDTAGARVALSGRTRDGLEAVAAALQHDPVVVSADLSEVDGPAEWPVPRSRSWAMWTCWSTTRPRPRGSTPSIRTPG